MSDALTAANAVRPTLHLSGAKLRAALSALIRAAETVGGIERLSEAVKLKAELFQERLGEGRSASIERASFEEIARFMPTVRRRIGPLIAREGWPEVRAAIAALLHDAHVPGTGDSRIAAFESALRATSPSPRSLHLSGERVGVRGGIRSEPKQLTSTNGEPEAAEIRGPGGRPPAGECEGEQPSHRAAMERVAIAEQAAARERGQTHGSDPMPNSIRNDRFIRDLAAELLHNVWPEHYPLMTRWVWDATANTGVLREIWHDAATGSDEVDQIVIDVPDGHETHLALREELSQFLTGEGIFRDMIWYVDLISAQVYGDYINAQGAAYLKTDFNAAAPDPLEHTRRILGLDARGASKRGIANGQ